MFGVSCLGFEVGTPVPARRPSPKGDIQEYSQYGSPLQGRTPKRHACVSSPLLKPLCTWGEPPSIRLNIQLMRFRWSHGDHQRSPQLPSLF